MRKVFTLRARIISILSVLVLTMIGSGMVTIWYAGTIESLFTTVVDKDVTSFQVAVNLETALARQKGFTSYYFMDGNPDWLRQLEQHHQIFRKTLREARESVQTGTGRKILDRTGTEYTRYNDSRRRVIGFYQSGEKEAGLRFHMEIRRQFMAIYNLCEQYKGIHEKSIAEARNEALSRTRFINAMVMEPPGLRFDQGCGSDAEQAGQESGAPGTIRKIGHGWKAGGRRGPQYQKPFDFGEDSLIFPW